jgi:hypothetical protein
MWLAALPLQPQGAASGWVLLEDPATARQGIMPANHLGQGKAARRAPRTPRPRQVAAAAADNDNDDNGGDDIDNDNDVAVEVRRRREIETRWLLYCCKHDVSRAARPRD